MSNLSPRQQRFVEEYPIYLCGKRAAIRAGYSAKTAEQQASRLLRNVKVKAAIEDALAERSERTEMDQDWVMHELRRNYERAMEGTEETIAVMVDGELKHDGTGTFNYNGAVANKSLELISKHLGMFKEKADEPQRERRSLMTDAQIQRLGDIPGVPPMRDITPRKH